jgi:hypothetical protein
MDHKQRLDNQSKEDKDFEMDEMILQESYSDINNNNSIASRPS